MGLRSPNRILDKNSEVKRTREMEEVEGAGPGEGFSLHLGPVRQKMFRRDGASLFNTRHAAYLAAKQSVVIYHTENPEVCRSLAFPK